MSVYLSMTTDNCLLFFLSVNQRYYCCLFVSMAFELGTVKRMVYGCDRSLLTQCSLCQESYVFTSVCLVHPVMGTS